MKSKTSHIPLPKYRKQVERKTRYIISIMDQNYSRKRKMIKNLTNNVLRRLLILYKMKIAVHQMKV